MVDTENSQQTTHTKGISIKYFSSKTPQYLILVFWGCSMRISKVINIFFNRTILEDIKEMKEENICLKMDLQEDAL